MKKIMLGVAVILCGLVASCSSDDSQLYSEENTVEIPIGEPVGNPQDNCDCLYSEFKVSRVRNQPNDTIWVKRDVVKNISVLRSTYNFTVNCGGVQVKNLTPVIPYSVTLYDKADCSQ